MDLTGWTYCLTLGHDLYVYGKGRRRVAIDDKSGRVVLSFDSTIDMIQQEEEDKIYGNHYRIQQRPPNRGGK
jgi:hypothetical protein